MPATARRPRSLILIGGTATAFLLSSTGPALAVAPGPAVPLVELDAAFAGLPAAQALPGAVVLSVKLEAPASASLEPCLETGVDLPFKAGEAAANYNTANKKTPQARTAEWTLTTVVFHTAKLAKAAAAKLVAAEKACPKTAVTDQSDDGLPFVRMASAAYQLDGWTGWRTVDEFSTLNLIDGPYPIGERVNDVYLTRGNLMLHIDETGDIEPGTEPRQDEWRRTVTGLMIAGVSTAG